MQVVYVGGVSLEAGVGCRESEAWEVYVLLDYCFRQPEPGSAQALQGGEETGSADKDKRNWIPS